MGAADPTAERERLAAALRELHPHGFGWAMTCCARDRVDAEDALQSAYAKVLSGDAKFAGQSSFKTWLFGVIRVTALEQRTRRSRQSARTATEQQLARHAVDAPLPDEELASAQRARVLADALGTLAERQAEVLHLVFYEGLTLDEAAAAMDVTPGTARTHYDRGKKQLLAELAKRGRSR